MMTAHRHLFKIALASLLVTAVTIGGTSFVSAQTAPYLTPEPPSLVPLPAQDLPANSAIGNPEAPNQVTLTAIPPRLGDEGNLKAKPGEKIQTVIRIRNSASETMAIQSIAQDFIIGEDGTTPLPVTGEVSNRWSLASWMTISPTSQVIQPRQTAQVNVVIDVPSDALPGGHYAMVLHEPVPISPEVANGELNPATASRVSQRVGTLIYFTVEGPINEEAFIRDVSFPSFTEYGPVPFTYTVENVSDIHIRPQVTIDIYNFLGQKVDTMTVEPKNVFPYVSRDFEGQWDRVWGIGPYTAKLTMSFGTQGKVAMSRASFWLIPYKLVVAAAVILLVIISLFIVIRRHWLHRQSNEQGRIKMLEERLAELESNKIKQLEE